MRATIDTWTIPGLSKIPVLGPAFFSLTPLDYLAFLMFAVIGWFLYRTRAGLVLRSVGESPQVAHSVGFPVVGVRYGAVAFGDSVGSIHKMGAMAQGLDACNGWTFWHLETPKGLQLIDELRAKVRADMD